jgi:hypothetical protein
LQKKFAPAGGLMDNQFCFFKDHSATAVAKGRAPFLAAPFAISASFRNLRHY